MRDNRNFILNLTFAAEGRHSSLWPETTTFERSQSTYLRPEAITVSCGQMPQHSKSHKTGTFWSPYPYYTTYFNCEATIIGYPF